MTIIYKKHGEDGYNAYDADGTFIVEVYKGWSRLGGAGWTHLETPHTFGSRDQAVTDFQVRAARQEEK